MRRKAVIAVVVLGAVLSIAAAAAPFRAPALHAGHSMLLSRKPDGPALPQPGPFILGPAKGRFLVAGRNLGDPRFQETVILLIRYDDQGAMGLIINRPSEVMLSAMFPHIPPLKKGRHRVFYGGPVAPQQMLMLVRSDKKRGESLKVLSGVYASSSRELLESLAREGRSEKYYRVYAGYAGWAPGQLDRELARDDWHIAQADEASLFEKESESLWPELIRKSAVIHVKTRGADTGVRFAGWAY